MGYNIKEELIDQTIRLKIEEDDISKMTYSIASAVIEIPNAASIEVGEHGIRVSNANEAVLDFEHQTQVTDRKYSIRLGNHKVQIILHGVRPLGLDHQVVNVQNARAELVLTFRDGNAQSNFIYRLRNEFGYSPR